MRIAYARVSTDKQELHRQLDALEKVGYDKLIQEKFTGTQKKRTGLDSLFNTVRSGDTVIIESISRLGRKTLDILSTVEELKEQDVEVISLKENLDTSTPTGQAMFQMMAVIAQLERDLTVQRVNEGLASAKARGVKLGRPIMDVFCKTFLHNIAKKKYTPLRLKFFSDYFGLDRAFLSRKLSPVKLKMCA